LVDGLRLAGLKVYQEPRDVDVSIVLSGKYENPSLLKGRKIIAFDAVEWLKFITPPYGWDNYKIVLEEYYDDFLNLTGMEPAQRVKAVKMCAERYAAA